MDFTSKRSRAHPYINALSESRMKRQGANVHSSPTRDRYAAGKRQQIGGEGRPSRGAKRMGAGSRDVSPVPSSLRTPLSSSSSHSTPTLQLQSQLQQQVVEVAVKTPIHDLIPRIQKFGFPSSCTFVLSLLERYIKASIAGDALTKINLPKKGALSTLLTYFLLCQPVMVKVAGRKEKVEQRPAPYSPQEDLQLLMCVISKIEEQPNLEHQHAMFEALFGGCEPKIKAGVEAGGTFFERLMCLAVTVESSPVLSCIALWMQTHPNEALLLSQSFYSCFCEHLPNAMEAPMKLASLSPQLSQHLCMAFTALFPYHVVGAAVPGMDLFNLQPPVRLLRLISHWVEVAPDFLYAARLIDRKLDIPLFHPANKGPRSPPPSTPLPGLMQWCILAPCSHSTGAPEGAAISLKAVAMDTSSEDAVHTHEHNGKKGQNGEGGGVGRGGGGGGEGEGGGESDMASLVAHLHASLLSVILSNSQSFQHGSLTSDHIAVVVAALLGFSCHQPQQLVKRKRERKTGRREEAEDDSEGREGLKESVERLAQFLQISLSAGLLDLSPDDLSSMASTLPKNRLLALVIKHHSRR